MIVIRNKEFLEEREYGKISTFIKGKVKRARVKLGRALERSMNRDREQLGEYSNKFVSSTFKGNPEINKVLGEEAQKAKTSVRKGKLPGRVNTEPGEVNYAKMSENSTYDLRGIDLGLDSNADKFLKRNKKSVIAVTKGSGQDMLAHEIGHAKRINSKNPFTRFIQDHANSKETRERLEKAGEGVPDKRGLGSVIKNYLKGTAIVKEEAAASREGLKMLKRGGASPEQLKIAKENYKNALGTYKVGKNLMWKTTLQDTLYPNMKPRIN